MLSEPSDTTRRGTRTNFLWFLALAWGFAEATLFFIVPDVLLTGVAIRSWRRALWCCLMALAGAVAGGMLIYWWGSVAPAQAVATVEKVPAISAAMMKGSKQALIDEGVAAIVLGPLTGTPFKTYAVQANVAGVSFWRFVLISIPARLPRFVLTTLFAAAVVRMFRSAIPTRSFYVLWLIAWTGFYIFYFVSIT